MRLLNVNYGENEMSVEDRTRLEREIAELTARVTELESREGFHEYTLETLNQTIIEQQKTIDYLKRLSQLLIEKVKNTPELEGEIYRLEDEIPPHY